MNVGNSVRLSPEKRHGNLALAAYDWFRFSFGIYSERSGEKKKSTKIRQLLSAYTIRPTKQ